jgi:hypothetical protein
MRHLVPQNKGIATLFHKLLLSVFPALLLLSCWREGKWVVRISSLASNQSMALARTRAAVCAMACQVLKALVSWIDVWDLPAEPACPQTWHKRREWKYELGQKGRRALPQSKLEHKTLMYYSKLQAVGTGLLERLAQTLQEKPAVQGQLTDTFW